MFIASSIYKIYLYILIVNVKQYWLGNVDGVLLVNVSWLPIGQQCLGLLLPIGLCLLPTKGNQRSPTQIRKAAMILFFLGL
jgi:hypothetical protein